MRRTLLIVISLLTLVSCGLSEWPYKAELPNDASEIKEFSYSEMDYTYYLRANMSRDQFAEYIEKFDMRLHSDTSTYADDIFWLDTETTFKDQVSSWWDSELNKDSMYVHQQGHEWQIARFSDGTMYLNAHSH